MQMTLYGCERVEPLRQVEVSLWIEEMAVDEDLNMMPVTEYIYLN
jgi:hypothetical protein